MWQFIFVVVFRLPFCSWEGSSVRAVVLARCAAMAFSSSLTYCTGPWSDITRVSLRRLITQHLPVSAAFTNLRWLEIHCKDTLPPVLPRSTFTDWAVPSARPSTPLRGLSRFSIAPAGSCPIAANFISLSFYSPLFNGLSFPPFDRW